MKPTLIACMCKRTFCQIDSLRPGLLIALLLAPLAALHAAEFHVAPDGNDANPGTKDKPFATLERARNEVRKSKPAGGATVFVRGGIYSMPQGIVFEKQDSGTEEGPVIYRACEGEKPVLLGGRMIPGFTTHKDRILKADVASQGFKGVRFQQLFTSTTDGTTASRTTSSWTAASRRLS